MKLNKRNILAILPLFVSSVLAHSDNTYSSHHGMMGLGWGVFGMFFMGLFTVLIVMAILWLAKEVGKK